jgi:putative DNA primase/helicase
MTAAAPATQDSPTLIAAIVYARMGWRVLPVHTPTLGGGCTCGNAGCKDQGKHPRLKNWTIVATTDEKTIRAWFTRWPDANVGIATGRASGIIVLDVDNRHGGMESLAELEKKCGELPKTPTVRTGDGYHMYFRHPGGTIKNAEALAGLPGLDVLGDCGFVVAPPSLHRSGATYLVEAAPDTYPLQDCTAFLAGDTKPSGNGHHGPKVDTAKILEGPRAGGRDTAIFKLASKCRALDVPQDLAERLAVEAAQNAEQPPGDSYKPEDASAKVRAVYDKYPAGTSQEPSGTVESFPRTDSGNAEMLADRYGHRLRYDHRQGRWLLWSAHKWDRDRDGEIHRLAKDAARARYHAAADIPDDAERKRESKFSIDSESRGRIEAALFLAQSERPIADAGDEWDDNQNLVSCSNGILDLGRT